MELLLRRLGVSAQLRALALLPLPVLPAAVEDGLALLERGLDDGWLLAEADDYEN